MFATQSIDQPKGRFTGQRIEPQIERPVGMEAEASFGIRQLIAGKSKIEQNAIHERNVEGAENLRQIGVIGVNELNGQISLVPLGRFDGCGITIERNDPATWRDAPGKFKRVAAPPQRAVGDDLTWLGVQPIENFGHENGDMLRWECGHSTRRRTAAAVKLGRAESMVESSAAEYAPEQQQ